MFACGNALSCQDMVESGKQCIQTLVLLSVWRGRSAQKGDAQDVAAAREPVLGLRENSNTIAELAQVGILDSMVSI